MATVHFDLSNTWTVIAGGASSIGLTCAIATAKAANNLFVRAAAVKFVA